MILYFILICSYISISTSQTSSMQTITTSIQNSNGIISTTSLGTTIMLGSTMTSAGTTTGVGLTSTSVLTTTGVRSAMTSVGSNTAVGSTSTSPFTGTMVGSTMTSAGSSMKSSSTAVTSGSSMTSSGTTITPGSSMTSSGTAVTSGSSMTSSGTAVTSGSSMTSSGTTITSGSSLTSSGTTITPGPSMKSSGTTITPGSSMTSSGTTIAPGSSMTSSSTTIKPGSSMITMTSKSGSNSTVTSVPPITIYVTQKPAQIGEYQNKVITTCTFTQDIFINDYNDHTSQKYISYTNHLYNIIAKSLLNLKLRLISLIFNSLRSGSVIAEMSMTMASTTSLSSNDLQNNISQALQTGFPGNANNISIIIIQPQTLVTTSTTAPPNQFPGWGIALIVIAIIIIIVIIIIMVIYCKYIKSRYGYNVHSSMEEDIGFSSRISEHFKLQKLWA